ncbi:MAG TPA: hypothetical protein VFJ19_10055 [Nocardioidaceae bacterium]|nr:hypothetical protein [Nocardioidaceae bacterium]
MTAIAGVVVAHQMAQARMGQTAVAEMLAEQGIRAAADALLNLPAFTTSQQALGGMLEQIPDGADFEFERLVQSLIQDAGRAAESVATAVREDVGWVRQLTPPSCSRCVVLAGRVYRWSDGFLRHPGDDCITVAVRDGDETRTVDPLELYRNGQVRGLSKADAQALEDGADFNQVVNVRSKKAGLSEAGEVLSRAGRPTPAGIYRASAGDHDKALALLARHRYIL